MTKKLFVGGLSWGTKDEQLQAAFAKFGTVAEAKVILDHDTGRSRGFGFVTIEDDSAAELAIREMDGTDLDGRTIRVNEAQERARPPRDGGGGRPGGPRESRGSGAGPGRSGGGGAGGGRTSFRSDDRPPAGKGRRRTGRPGEGRGEDRFARRRNASKRGGGGRDTDDLYGESDGGYDEF